MDASAIVALFLGEPEASRIEARLRSFGHLFLAAPTLVETRIVLTRRLGRDVREDVDELLERFGIEKSSFDPTQADLAPTRSFAMARDGIRRP